MPTHLPGSAVMRAHESAVRMQLAKAKHRDGLTQFLSSLSPDSAHRRFFGADPRPTPRMLDLLLCNDRDHVAAVATIAGCVVGHAMLARGVRADGRVLPTELAVVVADAWQHHGIGPSLVRYLIEHASRLVVGGVEFTVLADNLHANTVVQRLWPLATMTLDHGVIAYRVDIDTSQRVIRRAPLVA